MSMSMSIYIGPSHYRTLPLMRSVHRVLLKQMRLQQATEAGDAEIWSRMRSLPSAFQTVRSTTPNARWPYAYVSCCRPIHETTFE